MGTRTGAAQVSRDGAEAVDAAIANYAGQERKSNRHTRRRSIDERLKRLADLYDLGDLIRTEYLSRKNDLLIERDQLEAQPAAPSIALQRQQLKSVVDDWSIMTDEDTKRVLQIIFSEIRADHTDDGLKVDFRPTPIWEPYVEAVSGTTAARGSPLASCYHFGAEDGTRTRDPHLGKVMLYQLSHFRMGSEELRTTEL